MLPAVGRLLSILYESYAVAVGAAVGIAVGTNDVSPVLTVVVLTVFTATRLFQDISERISVQNSHSRR